MAPSTMCISPRLILSRFSGFLRLSCLSSLTNFWSCFLSSAERNGLAYTSLYVLTNLIMHHFDAFEESVTAIGGRARVVGSWLTPDISLHGISHSFAISATISLGGLSLRILYSTSEVSGFGGCG